MAKGKPHEMEVDGKSKSGLNNAIFEAMKKYCESQKPKDLSQILKDFPKEKIRKDGKEIAKLASDINSDDEIGFSRFDTSNTIVLDNGQKIAINRGWNNESWSDCIDELIKIFSAFGIAMEVMD